MTNKELCKVFVSGAKEGNGSNMHIYNNKLYSYSTVICERVPNERGYFSFIYNETKYSTTTSRHQFYLRNALSGENVTKVNNVKMYEQSLRKYVK